MPPKKTSFGEKWKALFPYKCTECKEPYSCKYKDSYCDACIAKEELEDEEHQKTCEIKDHKKCERCRHPPVQCGQQ